VVEDEAVGEEVCIVIARALSLEVITQNSRVKGVTYNRYIHRNDANRRQTKRIADGEYFAELIHAELEILISHR